MDEHIAIARLKQGDPHGLDFLVQRYQVQAVYTAHLIVCDRALAEDVAQTAFVRAVEKIHQYDEQRPFAPWFFRIVVNTALKTAKRQRRTLSLETEPENDASALARWLIDPQPGPEGQLEHKETQHSLLHALAQLNPEQRAVIVMRYYLELSEAEMSEKLTRPLSTIKWWLRAARARLRILLSVSPPHEDDEETLP